MSAHPPKARLITPELVDRFRRYHAEHPAWGALHVVLDDGNFKLPPIAVVGLARRDARGDAEGAELGVILAELTPSQRAKIAKRA